MSYLQFTTPPLPHFIQMGQDTYIPGQIHIERKNIGVFDMLVVSEGCLSIEEEGQVWNIGAGQSLILRPDRHHRSAKAVSITTHFYWIHFQTTGTWVESSDGLSPILQRQYTVDFSSIEIESAMGDEPKNVDNEVDLGPYIDIKTFYVTISRFHHLSDPLLIYGRLNELLRLEEQAQHYSRWRQQRLFHSVLEDFMTHIDHAPPSFNAVQIAEAAASFIRQNYRSKFSSSDLGQSLKFHPTHISRCMKKVYGYGPVEYLMHYRLDRAKTLLMNTNEPIEQIAEQVGFQRASYFSHCFSRFEGVTPGGYRKQFRTSD